MKYTIAALTAALTLSAAPAMARQADTAAAPVTPRVAVRDIAGVIRMAYFDPEKAEVIAAALEAEAEAGRYDALTDPRDLQEALTERLTPYDKHFRVSAPRTATIASAVNAPAPSSAGLEPVPFPQYAERHGQGFQSVQILPGNIGLVDMRMFAGFESAEDPARRQVDAVLQLLSTTDAVIFDLRQNAGGSPVMVGYLVSAFVAGDAPIYNSFRSREGSSSEAPEQPYARPRLDVPLYVLTSARTASAGEAFAYTLQAAKRAAVVGETTAGAANPGGPAITPSGYGVFIATGSPTNPITGTNWEQVGVKPDIEALATHALTTAWKAALAQQSQRLTGALAQEAVWVLAALEAPTVAFTANDYLGSYGGSRIQAADGALTYQSGQRQPWRLQAMAADLFFDIDEPYRRVRFQRDDAGRVTALETLDSQTGATRFLRRE